MEVFAEGVAFGQRSSIQHSETARLDRIYLIQEYLTAVSLAVRHQSFGPRNTGYVLDRVDRGAQWYPWKMGIYCSQHAFTGELSG